MKNKKGMIQKLLVVIFMVVFIIVFFIALENDKIKRIEKSIVNFQTEYQQYISDEITVKKLDKLVESSSFSSNSLSKFYQNFKSNTLKKFEEDYLSELYIFNFLKNEDTTSFTKGNNNYFNKLIESNNNYALELEEKNDVETLKKFSKNNRILQRIASNELRNDSRVIAEYTNAKNNKGTTVAIMDDCFYNQYSIQWSIDKELSTKYCNKLKLSNCNNIIKNKPSLIGYTLNNPKAINSKRLYVDYVSYQKNDFRLDKQNQLKASEANYNVYAEVYYKEILGRKIYKYNVVLIEKDYELNCKLPK
ncbi:hypothetical protein OKW23_001383 [Bacilli bacterium PM5-9]|nr:hypothetical protein [Bacilli bacterium PM5-9]